MVVFMMTMMKGRHSLSLSLSLSLSPERKIPGGGALDLPLNPLSHPIRGGFLGGEERRGDDEQSTSCTAAIKHFLYRLDHWK